MSADNWETCPKCLAEARAVEAAQINAIMDSYGKIPVEEFDAARNAMKPLNPEDYRTFREDYEFYGAAEGTITADYLGKCSKCGLSVRLQESKKFWPEASR